jgi:hypothetical protein
MEAPISGTKDQIQHLFAAGQKPADIAAQHGYTHEQVRQALEGSGTVRFNSPARSASAPDLTLPLHLMSSSRITKEELLSPCPLTTLQQIRVFITRGCGDEEILRRLSDTTQQQVTAIRREMNLQKAVEANKNAMNHFDTLPTNHAKPRPKTFSSPNNGRKFVAVAAVAAGTWAIYSAYRVAINIPEQEWKNLSIAGKCKRVICGTPKEMASHVAYMAKRVIGR